MMRFLIIHNIWNQYLSKGQGLLPYILNKYYGWETTLATYKNGEYPNLKSLKGVNLEFIDNIYRDWVKDCEYWLKDNAKRFDVLCLWSVKPSRLKIAKCYKQFNTEGKVYIKCDNFYSPKLNKRLDIVDFFSIEHENNASYPFNFIPNCYNPDELRDYKPFKERSNIILTVGRIDSFQKNTEELIKAFKRIEDKIPDWRLKLVGKTRRLHRLYGNDERIEITGEISDREQLIEIYRDAKIFAFPSKYEGHPVALMEAMIHGCFAIPSCITPHISMTDKFKLAFPFSDTALLYACTHQNEIEPLAIEGREAMLERCNPEKIARLIHDMITGENEKN